VTATGDSEIRFADSRLRTRFSSRTDVGSVRKANEDSLLAQAPVFLVADGMGGHARGDAASQTVVRVFEEHIEPDAPSTPERILDAIHSSNDAVRDLSAAGDVGTAISGTTLAGVAFVDAGADSGYRWMVFNVGDSRVYSWAGDRLQQVTVDHSAVQAMVDAGLLDARHAEHHPERNVITRAIGADEYVDADVWLLPVSDQQAFLICSDGLTKELDDDQIARVLASHDADDGPSTADALVQAALDHGGHDNVSVVVVRAMLS
jgi:serine/threonine protein phosphatase PrpC